MPYGFRQPTKNHTLSATHPAIAKQWHPSRNSDLSLDMVTPGSPKIVWWQCIKDQSHQWEQRVHKRVNSPYGCPFCVTEEKSLAMIFPEIAKEWHAQLNGNLKPKDVAGRGRAFAWWQCPIDENHVWQAHICNRTSKRPSGCPFCAGKRVDQSNSLASQRPDLAKEWHKSKNGSHIPDEFTYGSQHKAWWQCQTNKKHEWQAHINSRTRQNTGCPFCSGRFTTDENRLSLRAPEIAAEWHPTKNRVIYADNSRGSFYGSINKSLSPSDRIRRDKKRLRPSDVAVFAKEIVWWKCKAKGHEWRARIESRTYAGQGCPYCSGRRVIANETSLAARFPAIAKQWHPTRNESLSPGEVAAMTDREVWWRCHRSATHVWKAPISKITKAFKNGHSGCPFCAGRRANKENNLATKFPARVKLMWHKARNFSFEPTEVPAGSTKEAWWQCPKSETHLWKRQIHQVTKAWSKGNSGCPFCKGFRFARDENLSAKYPDLVKYWDRSRNLPLKPSKVAARGYRQIRWKCNKGHLWLEAIRYVVSRWVKSHEACRRCRDAAKA